MSEIDRRMLIGVAGFASVAALSRAGPLAPPTGAIAPTGKMLTDVEPRTPINQHTCPGDAASVFRVVQPGSYYLTENLVGTGSRVAITVAADNVTLDLNGFSIAGTPGPALTFALDGERAVIRNGSIVAWGSYVTLGNAVDCIFEELRVKGPYAGNFEAQAVRCRFSRILIQSTGEVGIQTQADCLVDDCTVVSQNGAGMSLGILAGHGTIVRNCTVSGCGTGITAVGALIERCRVADALDTSAIDAAGITASGSTVRGCCISNGAAVGLRLNGAVHAVDNAVVSCNTGIADSGFVGTASRVERNTVVGCTNRGIRLQTARNIVVQNTVTQCGVDFDIAPGNTIGEVVNSTAGGVIPSATSAWANFRF